MPTAGIFQRVALIALGSAAAVMAQPSELWSDGHWTVQGPPAGYCPPMPVLAVRGPAGASILEPAHAEAWSALQRALPAALAKVCQIQIRQVLIVSGRARQLLDLEARPRDSSPAPATAIPAGTLRRLDSVKDEEDRCEILFNWLETSKAGRRTAAAMSGRQRNAEAMSIFADGPMEAVFGSPYDRLENRARLELHEKMISPCLGMQRPRRGIVIIPRIPSTTMQQYWGQFQQYRQILDQAFLGQPGMYEPTAITQHLQLSREQVAWVAKARAEAARATPVRESFDSLTALRQQARTQMSLLGETERAAMDAELAKRQSELAPAIASAWLESAAAAGQAGRGPAAAKELQNSQSAVASVLAALDGAGRTAWNARFSGLIVASIAAPLQAELGKLKAIPATMEGARQLAAWKNGFELSYRDLAAAPAVGAAATEYRQASTRVLAGALPVWTKSVEAAPLDGAGLTAKRRELEVMFPPGQSLDTAAMKQFEAPLRAREDQLRARLAAAASQTQPAQPPQPQPQQPQPAAKGTSIPGSFYAKGLTNEQFLNAIHQGDFVNINVERENLQFGSLFEQYLRAFGQRCTAHLPPNKVEMMSQECATERVTRNGYGAEISRTCVDWVTVGTGVFADPVLYEALGTVRRMAAGDAARTMGRMLTGMANKDNPLASTFKLAGDAISARNDMQSLVQMNECAAPGLRRFEENMRLFALNRPGVKLHGNSGPPAALMVVPGLAFRDHNYTRLLEELVSQHSTTWAMNRYQAGSVRSVSVVSRDPGGRPTRIQGSYPFNGLNGHAQGSVSVSFVDGVPECMYFFDYPSTCRTPNRKIAAAYTEGAYQQ